MSISDETKIALMEQALTALGNEVSALKADMKGLRVDDKNRLKAGIKTIGGVTLALIATISGLLVYIFERATGS